VFSKYNYGTTRDGRIGDGRSADYSLKPINSIRSYNTTMYQINYTGRKRKGDKPENYLGKDDLPDSDSASGDLCKKQIKKKPKKKAKKDYGVII